MAGSLKTGIAALPPWAGAALLLLVDQPDVGAAALSRLVGAWNRRRELPAASQYDGRLGVPAILPRRLWPEAKRLSGDVGARGLLRGNAVTTTVVALPEAAFDVDTVADRMRLENATGTRRDN